RIERAFYHSLKELKALQTNAVIEATLPRSVRLQVAPLGNAIEISKRTHQFEQTGQLTLLRELMEAPPPSETRQSTGLSST
ncbi:MAG TPA: hypothetical protein VIX89_02230, partial [Bryobacteraceae bacterium]